MSAFSLHDAERRAVNVGINLAAALYVWWRFRRPTLRRAAR